MKENTAPRRELFNQLLRSAKAGDARDWASMLDQAQKAGLKNDSILIGMLQPALYRAGLEWQNSEMSVAEEHRLTAWCEGVFSLLIPASQPTPPIDLLILQPRGNAHTIGARFAAVGLGARGLTAVALDPATPLAAVLERVLALQPRFIGISCALPGHVQEATELVTRLRTALGPGVHTRFVLSGFAFRLGGDGESPVLPPGIEVVRDLEEFCVLATEARPATPQPPSS